LQHLFVRICVSHSQGRMMMKRSTFVVQLEKESRWRYSLRESERNPWFASSDSFHGMRKWMNHLVTRHSLEKKRSLENIFRLRETDVAWLSKKLQFVSLYLFVIDFPSREY
jgi:hypothetical protein